MFSLLRLTMQTNGVSILTLTDAKFAEALLPRSLDPFQLG